MKIVKSNYTDSDHPSIKFLLPIRNKTIFSSLTHSLKKTLKYPLKSVMGKYREVSYKRKKKGERKCCVPKPGD